MELGHPRRSAGALPIAAALVTLTWLPALLWASAVPLDATAAEAGTTDPAAGRDAATPPNEVDEGADRTAPIDAAPAGARGPAFVPPAAGPSGPPQARRNLRRLALVGPVVVTSLYGIKAWDWGSSGWHWSREREWGFASDSGGSDKVGHAFAMHVAARSLSGVYERTHGAAGGSRGRRIAYAAAGSLGLGIAIEIGDAFTDEFGFSWGDVAADAIGAGSGLVLEISPRLSALIGFSCEYYPSPGFRRSSMGAFDIATDNTGWRYLANLKADGLRELGVRSLGPLRYVTVDIGFHVQGYTDYDRGMGRRDRRYWSVGVSLNSAALARDLFKARGRILSSALPTVLSYYHLPLGVRSDIPIDE